MVYFCSYTNPCVPSLRHWLELQHCFCPEWYFWQNCHSLQFILTNDLQSHIEVAHWTNESCLLCSISIVSSEWSHWGIYSIYIAIMHSVCKTHCNYAWVYLSKTFSKAPVNGSPWHEAAISTGVVLRYLTFHTCALGSATRSDCTELALISSKSDPLCDRCSILSHLPWSAHVSWTSELKKK